MWASSGDVSTLSSVSGVCGEPASSTRGTERACAAMNIARSWSRKIEDATCRRDCKAVKSNYRSSNYHSSAYLEVGSHQRCSARCYKKRALGELLCADVGTARRARRMVSEPRVDALGVERVSAWECPLYNPRHAPHHDHRSARTSTSPLAYSSRHTPHSQLCAVMPEHCHCDDTRPYIIH